MALFDKKRDKMSKYLESIKNVLFQEKDVKQNIHKEISVFHHNLIFIGEKISRNTTSTNEALLQVLELINEAILIFSKALYKSQSKPPFPEQDLDASQN